VSGLNRQSDMVRYDAHPTTRYQLISHANTVLWDSEWYADVALKSLNYPGSRIKTIRVDAASPETTALSGSACYKAVCTAPFQRGLGDAR
jgi:hypothetical protein